MQKSKFLNKKTDLIGIFKVWLYKKGHPKFYKLLYLVKKECTKEKIYYLIFKVGLMCFQ